MQIAVQRLHLRLRQLPMVVTDLVYSKRLAALLLLVQDLRSGLTGGGVAVFALGLAVGGALRGGKGLPHVVFTVLLQQFLDTVSFENSGALGVVLLKCCRRAVILNVSRKLRSSMWHAILFADAARSTAAVGFFVGA